MLDLPRRCSLSIGLFNITIYLDHIYFFIYCDLFTVNYSKDFSESNNMYNIYCILMYIYTWSTINKSSFLTSTCTLANNSYNPCAHVTWKGNNCHWYFLVLILSRNYLWGYECWSVQHGGFFSFCHFCRCGRVTLTSITYAYRAITEICLSPVIYDRENHFSDKSGTAPLQTTWD